MTLSLAVTFVAWLLAGIIGIVTGMGGPLLSLTIMFFFVDLQTIIVTACVVGFFSSLPLVWRFWRSIDWRRNWLLFFGSLPGVLAGVMALKLVPIFWMELAIGVLLVAFSVWQAWAGGKGGGPALKETNAVLLACGAASGFFSGAVGLGGPPVAVCAYKCRWDKDMARGLFGSFFALSLVAAVVLDIGHGLITPDAWKHIFAAMPGMVLGTLAGLPLAARLPQELFRRLMLLVVFCGGLSLLFKAFFM
ncbi:MAG: sulfite exporter TauE/SafE family protein [Desulfovibrionaceae bacterium]|nr:sulfite exporter TauE/SafE family protein [Desulfovibrionaceae bacterium]